LSFSEPNSAYACANQGLWNNSFIRVGSKSIIYKQWLSKGVKFVKDLFAGCKERYLSFDEFKVRYGVKCNILHFYGLIRAIPKQWTRLMFTNKEELVKVHIS